MHYQNSPITEAVIDIRVEVASDFKAEMLEPIHDLIPANYPARQDVMFFQGQNTFRNKPDAPLLPVRQSRGDMYHSSEDTGEVYICKRELMVLPLADYRRTKIGVCFGVRQEGCGYL